MDGAKIREIRRSQGLTQQEFAEKLGTSRFMVNRWEAGVHQPNFEYVKRIAKVAGCTLDELAQEVAQ